MSQNSLEGRRGRAAKIIPTSLYMGRFLSAFHNLSCIVFLAALAKYNMWKGHILGNLASSRCL